MRIVATASKIQSFIWKFPNDSGAIGIYKTPINIPLTAVITDAYVNVLTGIVGGAAASFLINWSGNSGIIGFGNVVPVGVLSFPGIGIHATNTIASVFLQVFGNTFTEGKFIVTFKYFDTSNR